MSNIFSIRASIALVSCESLFQSANDIGDAYPFGIFHLIAAQEKMMRTDRFGYAVTIFFAVVGLSFSSEAQVANAELKDVSGNDVGIAKLVQIGNGVLISLSLKGLPSGEHAFHIHAVGRCVPPFTTAGGHFNPGGKKHGLEAAGGAHAGDMPNLYISSSGDLHVELVNTMITLAKGEPNSVFDGDGSAIVIHAAADDYKTDPAGNAGDRIACGVITQ